jgi:HAD superfamily hydrolase (TIGR01509 family)
MDQPSSDSAWPRAAVFDCDGLLLDSTHCWHRAYREFARRDDRVLSDRQLASLAGASVAGAAIRLSELLATQVSEIELRSLVRESFELEPPIELPGARSLVTTLTEEMPVGIASNGPPDVLERLFSDLGLTDMLETVVSAEDCPADKPAPDVYLEACRRLSVCPSDAIAFEDSALGARAARDAGLFVVAIPSVKGIRIESDLSFPRLDDPRLLRFLGLDESTSTARPPSGAAR